MNDFPPGYGGSEPGLADKIDSGHCPDCNHRGFVLGPRGGASINIECGNLECRSRFNIASGWSTHHVLMAQRISKEVDGGANWDRQPAVAWAGTFS